MSTYSISFNTYNPLPSTTSFLILTPSSITLNTDTTTCYI
jgi:hypothetical protein